MPGASFGDPIELSLTAWVAPLPNRYLSVLRMWASMLTTSVPGGNRRYGRHLPTSPFQRRIKKKYDILHKFAGDLLSISLCALIAGHASHTRAFSPLSPLSHAQSCRALASLYLPEASSLKPQASTYSQNPLISFRFVSSFAPMPGFHREYSGCMDWTRSAFLCSSRCLDFYPGLHCLTIVIRAR